MTTDAEVNWSGARNFIACNSLHLEPREAINFGSVDFYLLAAQSTATRRAYAADIRDYLLQGGALPATTADVARYLAASTHRSVATLKRRLAALADVHASSGHTDPTKSPVIRKLLRGIARVHGAPCNSAAPIRPADLARIVAAIPRNLVGLRDKALLLIGFACAMRRSELVALNLDDVTQIEGRTMLFIRKSKTDQFARGRTLELPLLENSLCPVTALRGWLEAAAVDSGPIFRSISRWNKLGTEALSSSTVSSVVQQRARACGLAASKLSAHSLRSGFATSALDAGISLPAVQSVTRHKTLAGVSPYVRAVAPASMSELPL